jgi:transposase
LLAPPPDDHDCGWKKYAEAQAAELALMKEKLEALERRVLGKKSERLKSSKLPPPLPPKIDPDGAARKRKDNASLREARLETETIPIPVPKEACTCPECGATELRRVGKGKPSTV